MKPILATPVLATSKPTIQIEVSVSPTSEGEAARIQGMKERECIREDGPFLREARTVVGNADGVVTYLRLHLHRLME
jgi:hypothetical protein